MSSAKSRSPKRGRTSGIDANERLALMAEVATFYYEDKLTQDEIGQRIGISTATVSRLLDEAHEKGVVEVRIRYPVTGVPELQTELAQRFGLLTARVLAGADDSPDRQLQRAGELAARYFQTILADGSIISVGWGRTLYELVRAVRGTSRQGLQVAQSMGALGTHIARYDNHEITRTLAERLNARPHYMHAPMIVESAEIRDSLLQDPNLRRSLDMARKANISLVGIGIPDPELSGLRQAGYIDVEVLESVRKRGGVGDIFVNYFNVYGQRCYYELDERTVGLHIEDLRNTKHAIGIAIGLPKAAAILGALRTGYLNALVTDEITAREIIRLAEVYPVKAG